jgi:DNA-binding NtrC family response regulator
MGMPDGSRIRVLLVEDDPDAREVLAELLSLDFDVNTASDGTSGLHAFTEQRPDIVVTDETLPGMAGTALAQRVKDLAPTAGIILVSGYHHLPAAACCDMVLRKPVDVNVLSNAVCTVYARYSH